MLLETNEVTLCLAADSIRRHFPSAEQFVSVGDQHSKSKTIKFVAFDNNSSRKLIARFSPTAQREVEAYESLLGSTAGRQCKTRIPYHKLLEPGLMVRDYVPGMTLNQLNTSFVASMEAVGFLRERGGLPIGVAEGLISIVFGPRLKQSYFFQCALNIFRSWSSHLAWERAIADHLSIPLPGEALRKPLDLLYHWHTSMIPSGCLKGRPSWKDVRLSLSQFLFKIFKTSDFSKIAGSIYSQVDELREISRTASLYDIHYDNLILSQYDASVYLIDLECAGLGYADFANTQLQFVDDLVKNSGTNEPPIWSNGWHPPSREGAQAEKLDIQFSGPARIILCGTSAYLRIIRTALETSLYIFALKWHLTPQLDENDSDIREFPEPWQSFQKLKRIARGCSGFGNDPHSIQLEELVGVIIYGKPLSDALSMKSELEEFRTNIRLQIYERESMAHLVSLRVAEFIRFLPFELVLNRKVCRREFDEALLHLGEKKELSDLESILRTTLSDILLGNVPYHLWNGNYQFSIERVLMQRVKRKIAITERVQSKRSEYWLNMIVERAVKEKI